MRFTREITVLVMKQGAKTLLTAVLGVLSLWGINCCSDAQVNTTKVAAAVKPPVAPVRPVTDTYWRTKVVDRYRWMEKGGPEFDGWLKGQDAYARMVLAKLPERAKLAQRVRQLDRATTGVYSVVQTGKCYFYLKIAGDEESSSLCVREGLGAKERVLLDPTRLGQKEGAHFSIDYFVPSRDGRFVAYAVSPGGSEDSTIFVRDVATGRDLAERISRTRFGGVGWRADGRSFFYNRLPAPPSGTSPLQVYFRGRTYLHRIGTSPERDLPVWGYGVSPRVPMQESDVSSIYVTAGTPYVFGFIIRGVQNEIALYVAPMRALDVQYPARTPWRKVADFSDAVTQFDVRGDTLYLLTHRNALRFKIVVVKLAPDGNVIQGTRRIVLPESRDVITTFGMARDALYMVSTRRGISHLRRIPFATKVVRPTAASSDVLTVQTIALPYQGMVSNLVANPLRDGVVFGETSWTHSPLLYRYDPQTQQVSDTCLRPLSSVRFPNIMAEEVEARAPDGTPIPLSIVYRRDLKRDGSHPTLLMGYGAYGVSLNAYFSPVNLAWLERGGVFAVAHVRGGGEGGDAWHQAGMKSLKSNSYKDFIACAEYLVKRGYTSPRHLAAQGGSAGGITMGRALTLRPDLFEALVINVGDCDALRSELMPSGPANIPEFGSFTTKQGFHDLYEMDAYLHVRDGAKYPAVLLTTGANDPRVAPWEPAKMTARLQAATKSGEPVLLRVDYDAGHGIGSTTTQQEAELTDTFAFLLEHLT